MMSKRSVPRRPAARRLTLADIDVVLPAGGAAPGGVSAVTPSPPARAV